MENANANALPATNTTWADDQPEKVVDFCMKRTVRKLMENADMAFEAAANLRDLSAKLDRLEQGVAKSEKIMKDFSGALGEERKRLGESLDLHHNCMRAIDSGSTLDMTEMAKTVKLVIEH